jgi:hypothetical protein
MSVVERPQGVEGRLAAGGQLLVHILLDLVHRHMAGAFDHHLHVCAKPAW